MTLSKLKVYFSRYYKYIKKDESAAKREVAIHYAKMQADKLNKSLILDLAIVQKEKDTYIKEESNKLLLSEEVELMPLLRDLGLSNTGLTSSLQSLLQWRK